MIKEIYGEDWLDVGFLEDFGIRIMKIELANALDDLAIGHWWQFFENMRILRLFFSFQFLIK